ncbi:MAG TPA: GNAT family N-acetyltransferase [Ignavibacteriales bacterium]|nr:GNAT family N-acetyltransferase [Ignavibacteriales bacterium]
MPALPSIISLTEENLLKEDICCAKSSTAKNMPGVTAKKNWMFARFKEGLKFKKISSSAKIFIEYIPAEYAWRPVEAPGYMFIHCLWVSGSAQGKGYAEALLNECEKDSKNMNGIAVITSKRPFLTDKAFFLKYGFEVCDTADPYFEMLVKKYKKSAPDPKFKDTAKKGEIKNKAGIVIYYTDQCPFTAFYIDEMKSSAEKQKVKFKAIKLKTTKEAQSSPSPHGTFGIFYNGKFLNHEIMSADKFAKVLSSLN